MQIKGMEKVSLVDYDGYVACTVFVGGCNFRCPFCHNSSLVCNAEQLPNISEEEVFTYLDSRANLIDALCISGGEPTLQSDLTAFIKNVKRKGFLVKLDTNGTRPEVIADLLGQNLLDYIAMDVKSSLKTYAQVCGVNVDVDTVAKSIELIKSSNIPYEFRITLIEQFHGIEQIESIGTLLLGAKALYLQRFVKSRDCIKAETLTEVERNQALIWQKKLEKYVTKVQLRGY